MDGERFVVYGVKDYNKFYIMNTNPIVWTSDINEAKIYNRRYNAEYDILREYDTYKSIDKQLQSNSLDSIYLAMIDYNNYELGRAKIL